LAAFFKQTKAEEEPSSFFIEISASPLLMEKLSLLDRLAYHYLPCHLILSASLLHFLFAAQTHIMGLIAKNVSP
jgi:hypothetical protein